MACQTGKWRYGLLPLAALWIAANWIETGRIEADLASHARSALGRVAGGAGDPRVSGRDLTLGGVIADRGARAAALAGLAAVAGVRKVADGLSAPAAVATLASATAPAPPSLVAPQAPPVPQVPAPGDHDGAKGDAPPAQAANRTASEQTPPAPAPVAPAPLTADAQIAAPPPALQPAAQPAPPTEAAACQAEMAALVKDRPIQFASGSSRILPDSVPTLQALAAAAAKCPNVNFEIAGHTDDVGPVRRNDRMSRRRAENVLVYLVANGIAPERLTAAGYGEHRPLVPNDSDESRAKNRRIEFTVK